MSDMDTPPPFPSAPPTQAGPMAQRPDYSGVRIPMLISAIFNMYVALSWFSTCLLAPVGIPLLVLGIFEIIMFARLGDPAGADAAVGRARLYGILEICTILALNLPSAVCGIIVLINAPPEVPKD